MRLPLAGNPSGHGKAFPSWPCTAIAIFFLSLKPLHAADIPARWGHTAILLPGDNPYLFIHGGKTDPSASYSYTSARNSADLFALRLSEDITSTSGTSVDWQLFDANVQGGGSAAAYSWSVGGVVDAEKGLIAFFGGDGGTELSVQTNNDSTWLMDVSGSMSSSPSSHTAVYKHQSGNDLEQPIRKIYSAAATRNGEVFITGGEKADGSGFGYPMTYKLSYDGGAANQLKYTQLAPLPIDLAHHASVMLSNGTLLVLGGYTPSSKDHLPLVLAYSLDTTDPKAIWYTIHLSAAATDGVPPERRGHAATYVASTETVLIFGGMTGGMQGAPLDDVWELDLAARQWRSVQGAGKKRAEAEGPGGRYDHTAVAAGDQILIFGGYMANRPADSSLYIYDAAAGSWSTTFSAGRFASGGTRTSTSSRATATGLTISSTGISKGIVTTDSSGKTVTLQDPWGTSTETLSGPPSVVTGQLSEASGASRSRTTTAIAIGSSMGALALIALTGGLLYARRRKRGKPAFIPSGGRRHPSRKDSRPYRRDGDGAEGLLLYGEQSSSSTWSNKEKYNLPPLPVDEEAAGGPIGSESPSPKRYRTIAVLREAPSQGKLGEIVRVKATEKRLDMLSSEDHPQMPWPGLKRGRSERAFPGATGEDIEGGPQPSSGGSHDSVLRSELKDVDAVIGLSDHVCDASRGQYSDHSLGRNSDRTSESHGQSLRGICSSQDHHSSGDVHDICDPAFVSFAESGDIGNPFESPDPAASLRVQPSDRNVSDSSGASMITGDDSAASQLQASLLTARKQSIDLADAKYVPIKRGDSLLKRLTTNGFGSLFHKGTEGETGSRALLNFRDPATPPRLSPLLEPSEAPAMPSAWRGSGILGSDLPGGDTEFTRSVSSLATAHTADSEALALYGLMDIVQRQRDASSTTEGSVGRTDTATASPVSPPDTIQPVQTNETAPGPTSPTSPVVGIARAIPPPRGPSPPSPHKRRPLGVPDRSVKDIAASINRRAALLDTAHLAAPSPLIAASVPRQDVPPMHTPSRNIRSPQGPRPKTVYQLKARDPLTVTNA